MSEKRDERGWRDRCDFCGWPLGEPTHGCAAPNDCSQRPLPHNELTAWKQEIRRLEAENAALRSSADAQAAAIEAAREALTSALEESQNAEPARAFKFEAKAKRALALLGETKP